MPVIIPNMRDFLLNQWLFIIIFLLIVFAWITVDLWGRFINNLTFVTLKLSPNSTLHTFIIALVVTLILWNCFAYLATLGYDLQNQIAGGLLHDNNTNNETDNGFMFGFGDLTIFYP